LPSASDATAAQLFRELFAGFDLQVRDHHLGAVLGRHARGRRAEARRAAGDKEHAILDLHGISVVE
jgi:hypothetical protein